MSRLRRLLKYAWAIARPYWFSEDRWAAWGLLLAVVTLNLGIVFINVLLNKWNNTFYNLLQDKNYDCSSSSSSASRDWRAATSSWPCTSST